MEYEEAEALLQDEDTDPNAGYDDGTTGLHMAAINNSVEWASLCITHPDAIHPVPPPMGCANGCNNFN